MLATAPSAAADDIVVRSSIQAAVDAARPGDTVVVPPGRYQDSVTITKSGITIRGGRGRSSTPADSLSASAWPRGRADRDARRRRHATSRSTAAGRERPLHRRPPSRRRRLHRPRRRLCGQRGVRDLPDLLAERGDRGQRRRRHDDAAIYVGNSHDVLVEHNHAADSTVGIEIENSTGLVVRDNTAIGNTSGIVTFVLPGLALPATEDVLIERNVVMHNSRPNPVLPSEDVVGLIPAGTGILTVGADRVIVRNNRVIDNDSVGIAVIALPFPNPDPRVDPFPDGNQLRSNIALANGRSPDPLRSPYPDAGS